jgi:hypothetical protein
MESVRYNIEITKQTLSKTFSESYLWHEIDYICQFKGKLSNNKKEDDA